LDITCVVDENVQFSFTLFNDVLCSLDGLDVRDIEVDGSDVKVFLPELLTIILSCQRSRNCTSTRWEYQYSRSFYASRFVPGGEIHFMAPLRQQTDEFEAYTGIGA
jgi:hypothetical protein